MTEPHVGYRKNQTATKAARDTTHANAVVIDAVTKFSPQSDQRGQEGEMHDVFIVTSEGSGGEHIVRTVYAASDDDARAKHTRKTTPTSPSWQFTNEPSRLVTSGGVRRHTEPFGQLEDAMDASTRITRRRQ